MITESIDDRFLVFSRLLDDRSDESDGGHGSWCMQLLGVRLLAVLLCNIAALNNNGISCTGPYRFVRNSGYSLGTPAALW